MADRIVWKIVLDFLIAAGLGIVLLFILLWAEPYESGYFENDMSIRLPFREQSVTEVILGVLCFGLVIVTVLIVEAVRDYQGESVGEKFIGGSLIPGWIWESYRGIGVFLFGAACQQLTSNTSKYIIGRFRPHFYDVCQPTPDPTSTRNKFGYIQDFVCVDNDDPRLKDIRLSFPSAHASFAIYCALYFSCYIQVKCKWRGSKLLRHLFQLASFLAAWYVGLSRVQENFHHWSDVAAGFIIGTTWSLIMFNFVLKPEKSMPSVWDEPAPQNVLPRPVLAR